MSYVSEASITDKYVNCSKIAISLIDLRKGEQTAQAGENACFRQLRARPAFSPWRVTLLLRLR